MFFSLEKLGEDYLITYISGQIIATSHDLTPNGGLLREIPLFQGNLGWWNIIICQDIYLIVSFFLEMGWSNPDGLQQPQKVLKKSRYRFDVILK